MYLAKLNIAGYKNFKDQFQITFCKGLSVLVGENGVGKSAIVDAIRLLLVEDEFGRSLISEAAFHGHLTIHIRPLSHLNCMLFLMVCHKRKPSSSYRGLMVRRKLCLPSTQIISLTAKVVIGGHVGAARLEQVPLNASCSSL